MNILTLISTLLRLLSSVPASSSFLTPHIDSILSAIASLVDAGEAGITELQALTEHIKAMAASGQDPTPEDWASLKMRSDAAHALIQSGGVPSNPITPSLPLADPTGSPPTSSTPAPSGTSI